MKLKALQGMGMLGSNSFIITDEATGKTAVVDPGLEGDFMEDIKPDFILLTHGHVDHVLCALKIKEKTGAQILAHSKEAELLASPSLNLSEMFGGALSIVPDRLLEDMEEIFLGSTAIRVLHTPGHSPGSCCYIAEDHLFSGDTLMAGSVGRADLPLGNQETLEDSLKTLKELDGRYFVHCGHGPDTDLEKERAGNPFLRYIY